MEEIIIGFSRPKKWFNPFSWLIRMAEGKPWKWAPMSHAYVKYFDDRTKVWIIFQASGRMVNFVSEKRFDKIEHIVSEYKIPVTKKTKLKIQRKAQKIAGAPYGVKEIVGFGLVFMASLVGLKIKNPFASHTSFFCSQIACDIIEEIDKQNLLDPATCSPLMLDQFLEDRYKKC